MRRRLLSVKKKEEEKNGIFPLYLNLELESSGSYILNPTPDSIAFCDYFINNATFDGGMNWVLELKPGELYIDGIEVSTVSIAGSSETFIPDASWSPYHEIYDDFMYPWFEIYLEDQGSYKKGTFRAFDDD